MPYDEPGTTAIVVMTGEAGPKIGSFYARHSNAGRKGMTPHVTLLVPFIRTEELDEEVEERLRRLFGAFTAFDYDLSRFENFATGVLYLAPDPDPPFVELVSLLGAEFPSYPPYGGMHEEVIPHVTVADSRDANLLDRIRAEVEPQLPIRCRADAATVLELGADVRWRTRSSFAFGSLQ
jgi:2'-5' RNA ligase